jgi:hypothetical protein
MAVKMKVNIITWEKDPTDIGYRRGVDKWQRETVEV